MFTLNSPDLPQLATLPSAGVPLGTFSASASPIIAGANFGAINTRFDSPLIIESAIAIPNNQGDSFSVVAPEDSGDIVSVSIREATYNLSSTPSAPQSGEFVFDYFSRELTVYPRTSTSSASGSLSLVGLANVQVEGVPTTDIEGGYPDFFRQWNIDGSISISRSFKGHPSASLRFTSSRQNTGAIRQSLQNGTPVQLYGVAYLVQNIKVVELSPRKYPQGLIFVEIQLQGKWDGRGNTQRSPLDKPLKIKNLSSNGQVTVSQLAGAASVPYTGPALTIKVPNDTPSSTATTVRSEVESRAILAKGFPYYSNPSAVEIRSWGRTTVHFLSDADLLNTELSFDLPGHAALFEGLQLTEEFNNVVLNLDTSSDDAATNERITLYEGDPFPGTPPRYLDAEPGQPKIAISLRDMGIAYPGGVTKTRKKVTYLNGSTLEEEEEVWGFLFCSVDVYEVVNLNGVLTTRYNEGNDQFSIYETYWEKVKEVKTTYIYREDGYLDKIERRGWEKARFKQEGSSLEAIGFKKQLIQGMADGGLEVSTANRIEKIIQMYQYPGSAVANTQGFPTSATSNRGVFLPVDDTTENTLEKFSKYYADITPKTPQEIADDDPDTVFCKQETRTDNSYMLTPDPESTSDDEKPPLTTGKKFQDVKAVEVVYPRPGGQKSPEIYRENQTTANAQGPALRNALNISYYRENKGRPGVHTRIIRDVTDRDTPAPSEDYSKYKYLLNSFDFASGADDPEGGSISFPGVDNPEEGRNIAECELSMRNSQKAETTQLQIQYSSNYAEGDLVNWRGYYWVIFGIQDNQKITRRGGNPVIVSESLELSLGRLLKPPVKMTRVLKNNE